MKIGELIDNGEFAFNTAFRICKYNPPEIGSNEEGESTLVFDSNKDSDIAYDIMCEDISAVNQGKDGALEIEYVECW